MTSSDAPSAKDVDLRHRPDAGESAFTCQTRAAHRFADGGHTICLGNQNANLTCWCNRTGGGMFMELFAHALHLWSTRRPADRTAITDLSEELSRLCGPSTNIYGIDMRPDDPMAFGFDELLGNVDLEGGGPTLGDYPDRQYILRDVLPHYRLVRDTGDPDVRNLRSAIQDKVAVYDRLILPVGDAVRRPRRALVLSHVRLVLPLPREHARLSRREREILELLTLGLSAKEIGRALGTSNRTVEHQIGSIRDKLGARNLAHAVSLAIAQDLCRPSVLSPSLPRPAGRIASPAFTWRRPALS